MTATRTASDLAGSEGGFDLFEALGPARSRRRRNWPRMAAALGLAVASGALFVALYASAGARRPVLAVARAVPVGSVITASDLRAVRVAEDPGLAPIGAGAAQSVVGQRAAVALVPGTLLTRADLSAGPVIPTGWASVGLDLKANQVPAGLVPGQTVAVVMTPPSGQAASPGASPSAGMVLVDAARVVSITLPTAASSLPDTEVTLAVPAALAPSVVSAEANDQVALVGLGR